MAFSYVGQGLNPSTRDLIIAKAVQGLEARVAEFDAIAVRGVSGMIVGSVIAHLLKKHLIVVRKPKEVLGDQHACNLVESHLEDAGRYLIVDDQISIGNTILTVVETIKKLHPALKPVGVWLWVPNTCHHFPAKIKDLNLTFWSNPNV